MAKILLVEDDENLREIYQARLVAEGYEIVSARNGEEALVVAKQEKPDLIIADIMMPRISGFEMLDILRNTEGMKHVRVIMLTALGQAEDKQRADKLGADRYLVKSQVTLEDIVHAAAEILGDQAAKPAPEPSPVATTPTPAPSQPVSTNALPTVPPAATAPSEPQPTAEPVRQVPSPTTTPAAPNAPARPSVTAPRPVYQPTPTEPPKPQATAQPASNPMPSTPISTTATPPVNATPTAVSPAPQPQLRVPPSQPSVPAQPTTTQTPSNQNAQGSQKEINNASQLAAAVNSLINGTSNQPTSAPQHGSVPHAGYGQQVQPTPPPQASVPQPKQTPNPTRPTTNQMPATTPRAFPTGAPAIAPEPPKPVAPIAQAPPNPMPYPAPNVTKPQALKPPEPQPPTAETRDSIAIKDKKTVSPLQSGGAANSDLNELLKKENASQNQIPQLNNQHQPGQVFTPGGSTSTDDPGKISL